MPHQPALITRLLWKLAKLLLVLWGLVWLLLLTVRFINPPTTAFMLQSDVPAHHQWIAITELPAYVPLAMVAAEDQRFPSHHGIDLTAISQAVSEFEAGDGLRGASTISQQTVKNLLLWPGRNFIRKGLEAVLAVMADVTWGKKRTLELYLNIAEFGKGIYGVEMASRHYFGHSARHLTRHQAAQLATLLPAPKKRDPHHFSQALQAHVDWVEQQMQQLGDAYLRPVLHE